MKLSSTSNSPAWEVRCSPGVHPLPDGFAVNSDAGVSAEFPTSSANLVSKVVTHSHSDLLCHAVGHTQG